MHTNWIQDTQALLNSKDESAPTRRLALQTALGLGYAASAAPLMAQTAVKTSGEV
jgi:carboxymethylenebutenolidase